MYLPIIKIAATVLAFIMGAFNIPFEMPGFSDEKIKSRRLTMTVLNASSMTARE